MKVTVYSVSIVALMAIYVAVLFELLHPHVSEAYRDFYIERTSTDWKDRFVHYPATPEQGITFSKAGFPTWVDHTFGLSWREDWGRWTDGNVGHTAGLVFTSTFTGPSCLHLTSRPVSPLVNKGVAIRFGKQTEMLRFTSRDFAQYHIDFPSPEEADRLEFLLPKVGPASSADRRHLGMGLVSLSISTGTCPLQ
jgi:hypothetical protein